MRLQILKHEEGRRYMLLAVVCKGTHWKLLKAHVAFHTSKFVSRVLVTLLKHASVLIWYEINKIPPAFPYH